MNCLIQITPEFPPAVSGVGDYAGIIHRELMPASQLERHVIIANPRSDVRAANVHHLPARTCSELLSLIHRLAPPNASTHVLLQYSGYGYAKRGCPQWLPDAFEELRKNLSGVRLMTYFHELYASGPVTTSAFWLSGWQRRIVHRLAALSDVVLANTEFYPRLLSSQIRRQATSLVIPVPSNVGEPAFAAASSARSNRLVIFGKRETKLRLFRDGGAPLLTVARQVGASEILDIGEPVAMSSVGELPVRSTGPLGAPEVSALLSHSSFGAVDYRPLLLAKSSVFAAYCAHGVAPVVFGNTHERSPDGIAAGEHFLSAFLPWPSPEQSLAVGQRAEHWYRTHSAIRIHLEQYRSLILSGTVPVRKVVHPHGRIAATS